MVNLRIKDFRFNLVYLFIMLSISCQNKTQKSDILPNIILIMTDDQGWGDTGYNGNNVLKTPHLDQMASEGIQFNRFYAAAPVCSPTRASCLTGRHPYRLGITFANTGYLKERETTLAEALKTKGYTTGHFGKWHLGTLTNDEIDANRGGRNPDHYAPPWDHGFDVSFSTESKVPTWDPMLTPSSDAMDIGQRIPGDQFGTSFWTGPGRKATENLEGDASRVVMDRAIPFIENASKTQKPFLAVIWFHTPHLPTLTSEHYKNIYENENVDIQHFYGSITAMDEQIGRLRNQLKVLKISDDTMMFFTSDNGPEGKVRANRTQGSTNGLKGRKRSLYEGGIRVPGIWIYPNAISHHMAVDFPVSTSDYYPTVLDIVGINMENHSLPIDGLSLRPLLSNNMPQRPAPIGFQSQQQLAWIENHYKLYSSDGENYELYNISKDAEEQFDLSSNFPEKVEQMKLDLHTWVKSTQEPTQN